VTNGAEIGEKFGSVLTGGGTRCWPALECSTDSQQSDTETSGTAILLFRSMGHQRSPVVDWEMAAIADPAQDLALARNLGARLT
jgi:hypothetical protein